MQRGIIAVAISVLMAAAPAAAAQKPKGGQPKTHAHAVSKTSVKPVKVKTVKTTGGGMHAAKSKTTVKTSKTTIKTSKKTTADSPSRTTKTAATTTPTGGTLSPVQQKLEQNPNLAAKLRTRLPAGTDLTTAAAGFKSLGEFVSTVNASYNHSLSFDGLKSRIVDEHMSLGQAMKDMR